MAEGERKLISIRDLAVMTGVSVPTLNRIKARGELPHHRIGSRVVLTPEDVTAFLDSCKVSAKKEAH